MDKKSQEIRIALSEAQYAKIKEAAEQIGLNPASFVRSEILKSLCIYRRREYDVK